MENQHTEILVLNTNSGNITFIDPANDSVVDTIAVGDDPRDLVYAPIQGNLFISLAGTNEVVVLDTAERRIVTRTKVGTRPGHVYLHPSGQEIWVANDGSGELSVLNSTTGKLIATLPAGEGHHKIAFTTDGRLAFATNIRSATVTIADANSHQTIATAPVIKTPHGIIVTPDDRYVLVCNNGTDVVSVIGVAERSVVSEIKVPIRPNYVRLSPDGLRAFVVHKTAAVSIIRLSDFSIEHVFEAGTAPERIVFSSDGRFAFVNDTKDLEITVIDVEKMKVTDRIEIGAAGWHQGMALNRDGSRLYAISHGSDSVSVLDALNPRVIKRIVVGDGPSNVIVT